MPTFKISVEITLHNIRVI